MSKYTITIEGDFEKGECEKCELYCNFNRLQVHCGYRPENCPLEEVKQTVSLSEVYRLVAGHSNYHGDSIISALTCVAEGKEVKPIRPLEEVKQGEWIISSDGYYPYCKNCNYRPKGDLTNFCPNCGADMRGGKE